VSSSSLKSSLNAEVEEASRRTEGFPTVSEADTEDLEKNKGKIKIG